MIQVISVTCSRARGQTTVKASHNIEEVPFEACQTVRATIGLRRGVVFFLMEVSFPTKAALAVGRRQGASQWGGGWAAVPLPQSKVANG